MAERNSADIWDQTDQVFHGEKEVLEFSAEAGRILLENGAEISRVEETMERIRAGLAEKNRGPVILEQPAESPSNHSKI